MSGIYTYRTNLAFSVAGCAEHEPLLTLRYRVIPGSPQTRYEPGSEPYPEITAAIVTVAGEPELLPDWMVDDFFDADEELRAELLSNAADTDEYASEQAADAKREEMRLGR